MNPVTPSEIKSLADYEAGREAFRQEILATKASRRIAVGANLTLLFENHDTVLYQIQEMLRVERIEDPRAIKHEIETYNELVPGENELTATLLIEFEDPGERDARLRELLGLEKHLALEVAGAGECRAAFDLRQLGTDRISSVHYLKFELGEKLAGAIRDGAEVTIRVDHPAMQAAAVLTEEQVGALREDLSAG